MKQSDHFILIVTEPCSESISSPTYNSPISCCDVCVFRYTAFFFNWLFSFSAPSTKTTYVSYTNHAIWLHILKMVWHGSGRLRQNRIQWLKPKHETSVLFVDKRMDSWTFFFPGYFIRKPRRTSKKWRQKLPFTWADNKTGHWQRGKKKKYKSLKKQNRYWSRPCYMLF